MTVYKMRRRLGFIATFLILNLCSNHLIKYMLAVTNINYDILISTRNQLNMSQDLMY